MPIGSETKKLVSIERKPDDIWWWRCTGEIIKTSNNKKSFDLWVKLHKKKCLKCRGCLPDNFIESGRVNQSGHLKIINDSITKNLYM